MPGEHVAGHPVSPHTYRYYGCRCDGCTAANTTKSHSQKHARDKALLRVQSRSQRKAVSWVRKNCPALWEQMLAESYEELGIERRKRGHQPDTTNPGTSPVDDTTLM